MLFLEVPRPGQCILSKRKNNKLIYEIICLVPHDYCQSVYNGRPNQSYYIGQQQVLSADICSQVPPLQRAESCQSSILKFTYLLMKKVKVVISIKVYLREIIF